MARVEGDLLGGCIEIRCNGQKGIEHVGVSEGIERKEGRDKRGVCAVKKRLAHAYMEQGDEENGREGQEREQHTF